MIIEYNDETFGCKYCGKPGYSWCCPECYRVFEDSGEEDEEEDDE